MGNCFIDMGKVNDFTTTYTAKLILFVMIFLLPNTLLAEEKKQVDPGPGVTLLIYHRFGDDRYPTTNVPTTRFKEQMAYLKDNDFQVIPLGQLVRSIKKQIPLPDKAVVITVDDGYKSVYDVAWPILKSYGYPFTVFVYVKATDKNYNDIMSWEDIMEMKAAGVDFQDHSYSHHRLGDWPKNMDEAQYRSWIHEDLSRGSRILKERLGRKPDFLAIPYGEYNSIVLEEAVSIGYEAVFSQDPGSVSIDSDLMLIPREPILGNEWSGIEHFSKVLHRVDMPIYDLEPSLAALSHPLVTRFGCRVKDMDSYVSGTLGIYVSGLGWKPAVVDGNHVYIDNDKPLERHFSRVTVSGRLKDSGRLAMRTWMLIQRPEKEDVKAN
ncbi:MAG: polysaccharide deacetylase family protein [Desulfobulbaceae bacterium]|uniref:Polysaccharide deacetylase family protein n=1 Tax=Candidatus Desulfobia pelagia TaxID=2841692 RepID=A0A8J6TGJ7_9BACT|nr:polysaccharide deacetylase family protein [Candidatus Desulfobia pelagia]